MLMDFCRQLRPAALAIITTGVCAPAAAELRFEPYGAINSSFARLTPEPGDSGLNLSEENSFGFGLALGADIAGRWALEAGFSDLGEATLSGAEDEDISYTALGLSAIFHVFGNPRDIADRAGIWSYLRLGFNQIDNDSNLDLEEADNTAVWAGIGFEWAFATNLSFRSELATFDGDAQALTAGLVYRPFNTGSRSGSRAASSRIPTPQPSTPPPSLPAPNRQPVQVPQNPTVPQRAPLPRVETPTVIPPVAVVGCEVPAGNEPVGADGCALLTGVRRDLQFLGNSAQLTGRSGSSITAIANILRTSPAVRIEIRAHALSSAGLNASQDLSRQRAVAVARALVGAGIAVNRLGARAFGNTEPTVGFGSSIGELLPDRIEFVVLR